MKNLTIALVLYYVLTMLFPHGDEAVSAQRIYPQLTMTAICLYLLYKSYISRRKIMSNNMLRVFFPLLILYVLYTVYPFETPEGINALYDNAIHVLKTSMAIPFMFVVYCELLKDEKKTMNCIFVIFSIQVFYSFYTLWQDRQAFFLLNQGEFDSNAGFILLCCVPMSLMVPIKRLRLYLYAILVLACIYSGQRSAALAAAITFPICIKYVRGTIKPVDYAIFFAGFVIVGIPLLRDAWANIEARNLRDKDYDTIGSGRSFIWPMVWSNFWSSNLIQIILGHGTRTVPYLLRRTYGMAIFSHNGWLDCLYMFGLVGIVMYTRVVVSLYKYNKIVNKYVGECRNLLLMIFLLFMVKSTTSHGNWDMSAMPLSLAISVIAYKIKMIKNC